MPDMPMKPAEADESAADQSLPKDVDALGEHVARLAQAVVESPDAPDGVKSAASDLVSAFQAFADAVKSGGEEGGAEPEAKGVTTPEQGASGAMPMSMAGAKRG